FSAAVPSLACSSGQYSMSNISASEIDSKRPIASASVMISTAHCARSAAILASSFERPRPNRPTPGTSATRGSGSSACLIPARRGVERLLPPAGPRILAREIPPVAPAEVGPRRLRGALEIIHALAFGRHGDERPVLGADGVVGRDHARLAVARDLRAVDEIEDRGAGAEVEDHAAPRAFDLVVLTAAGAAHDRGHRVARRARLRGVRRHGATACG